VDISGEYEYKGHSATVNYCCKVFPSCCYSVDQEISCYRTQSFIAITTEACYCPISWV